MLIKNYKMSVNKNIICFLLVLSIVITAFPISAMASNPFSTGQCTWWAYRRITEMSGKEPPVIRGNAGGWYDNCLSAGLTRGSTPVVGAIACWNNGFGNDTGHVAVVEAVYGDHIHISEYNWDVALGYNEKDLYYSNMNRSSASKPNRHFLGYIYINGAPGPNVSPSPTPDPGSTPQSGGSPVGVVDEVSVRNGNSIYIRGWAYDPDDQNHNVMLEAYIDTTRENATAGSGYQFRCTQDRPDVRAAYNLTGSTEYGFEDTHPTSLDGGHVIYIYATNQVGGGDHSLLGMYTLNFRDTHAPYGSVDVIEGGNGTLRVAGWAKDDDDPEAAVTAHVYIGGPAGSGAKAYAVKAEGYRSDVGNHAFDKVINITDVSEIGEKDIYIYWLNLGEGNGNPHIRKSATIKAPNFPNGAFDICQGGDGTVFVRGWAKDDDDPNACLEIHVYVGGRASNPDAEGHVIMADYYRSDVGQHGFNRTIAVNKTGEVEVHVYAINIGGGWSNTYLGQKTVTVNARETTPPEISNVTVEPDKDGYTVTCEVNDTESSIDRVVFPTWTLENGQDDLAGSWATADTVRGTIVDGRATFRVNRSDHNDEYGTYRTHIYAYDGSGNRAKYEVPDILYRHTVSFDANGGENAPESMTKYLCDSLVLPTEIPVRDGYFFIGYAADRNAEEAEYQPGGLFTEDEDTTLYAVWRPAVPDAELPADLTEIEEEAFAGSGFKFVEIPSGVTKIGDRAFADCPDLMYVKIPPAAMSISNNAFENAPEGLTIIGEAGSYAEFFAQKKGYYFKEAE